MDDEIEQLKSVLRSLVVSSPTQVDVRSLLRDYRNMIGAPVPLRKYGYSNPVEFLKERFSDCFLFSGITSNPVLTLIVPNTLKHIDKFVQKQKLSSTRKFNPKRTSVPEELVHPPNENLVAKTFNQRHISSQPIEPSKESHKKSNSALHKTPKSYESVIKNNLLPTDSYVAIRKPSFTCSEPKVALKSKSVNDTSCHNSNRYNGDANVVHSTDNLKDTDVNENESEGVPIEPIDSSNAVKNFLKKRLPLYNSLQYLEEDLSPEHCSKVVQDDDSGRHTSSSANSAKAQQLEQLKHEIMELIADAPDGVWCTDLITLYKQRYGRELNFSRFGYTSIISLVYCLEARVQVTRPVDTGDWLLHERRRAAPAPPALRPRRAPRPQAPAHQPDDPEDALPGIDFDPDVFPEDCMHYMESIESVSIEDLRPGAMVEVMVGEVYSPSHFWFIRLGEQYSVAMEDMMDDMTRYYRNEGQNRVLTRGAVRVGHYCASLYENDWHRSLIVKIIDSDTVKVRHVDYGTVDTVSVCALRPLRREWGALAAQACRARLAAVRPPAAGWRWPHAAAKAFLEAVTDRRLVANVVALDARAAVAEVLLIDTAGARDLCVGTQLVRAGHADPRPDCALRAADAYLYPRFEALESGAAPNYADVTAYLRHGIALDYVRAYRDHVPPPPAPASPASPSTLTDTDDTEEDTASNVPSRIPLVFPESTSPSTSEEPEPESTPVSTSESAPPPAPAKPSTQALLPPPTTVLSPHAPVYVPGAPYRPTFQPLPPFHAPYHTQYVRPAPPPFQGPMLPQAAGGVTLSVAECETYRVLSAVNPAAAHWFMVGAMGRAMSVPVAPRPPPPPPHMYPAHGIRPPPGFGT